MVILVSRALSVLYAVPRNPTPQGAAQSPAIQNPTPTTTVLSLIFDDEHQFGMHCLDDDCQETFSVPRTYGVRPDQGVWFSWFGGGSSKTCAMTAPPPFTSKCEAIEKSDEPLHAHSPSPPPFAIAAATANSESRRREHIFRMRTPQNAGPSREGIVGMQLML
ncbi:hypothetical protein EV356DRAFT_534569 [Viridothelium virens]|uniref:Uncharacterized protein n=1 Tax=Viridothelium virens TaxID=1048519 RepID=A0A6A6H4K1_VIRVR|nr:hypothetical protein EV356DRAFT_534569 [Viridothelium virens]